MTTVGRHAHAYPQVLLTAGDLVNGDVVAAPAGITAADALRLARRRRVRVLACGTSHHVLAEDLARAESLGLGELSARDIARPLPIVAARTPELAVRRALAEGAPAVIVAGKGVIARAAAVRTVPVRARLEKALAPPTRALLLEIGRVAAAQGARAFAVGGLVRDAWRGDVVDGDLDVVLTQVGGPPLLLRNDQQLQHHWLRFKLVGTRHNHDAIGAWIKVRVNGQTLSRQVMPTRSYLSQSELPVTIGLGNSDKVESVEVVWPGGATQPVTAEIDRLVTVTEP